MRPQPPRRAAPAARSERLKDVAAIVTPLWAFLGAVAAPLLGGGAVGRVVFIVAAVVILVLTARGGGSARPPARPGRDGRRVARHYC